MHHTSRVELGETLGVIALFKALGKVHDVLVGPCRMGFEVTDPVR
jgi:hypothetical protein